MPRVKKSDDEVRKTNASLRTMLSEARGEVRDAEVALAAILQIIEGTEYDEKARQAAEKAVEEARAERSRKPDDDGTHNCCCGHERCTGCGHRACTVAGCTRAEA